MTKERGALETVIEMLAEEAWAAGELGNSEWEAKVVDAKQVLVDLLATM